MVIGNKYITETEMPFWRNFVTGRNGICQNGNVQYSQLLHFREYNDITMAS